MSIALYRRAYHLGYLQKCAEMEKEAEDDSHKGLNMTGEVSGAMLAPGIVGTVGAMVGLGSGRREQGRTITPEEIKTLTETYPISEESAVKWAQEARATAPFFRGTIGAARGMAAGAGLTMAGLLIGLLRSRRNKREHKEHDSKVRLSSLIPGVGAYNLGRRMRSE